jgi:hypothetical protein
MPFIPLISLPTKVQFIHALSQFLTSAMNPESSDHPTAPSTTETPRKPGLKKIPAYWYPYTTYAKERWLGRELLEVVSTEFRDRSMEYYVRYISVPSLKLLK